jgi:hypothetical protein
VINENKEKGFELEVGRKNDKFKDYHIKDYHITDTFFHERKSSFQTGLKKISLDLEETKFNDDFLLMNYTVSKLKYFTSFRKLGLGIMVSPALVC